MGIGNKVHYLLGLVQKHGLTGLVVKFLERKNDREDQEYQKNWQSESLQREEWECQRKAVFPQMPLISVVVPAYETPEPFLRSLVESLQQQTYGNWQLCVGDGSVSDKVQQVLASLQELDDRICFCHVKNGGISENTNAALKLVRGSYVGFMDHDDCLAEDALYEVVRVLNENPDCQVLYTDEDKIDASGEHHFRPHRKTDYNPELLRHYNYVCHFVVVEKMLLDQVGGLRSAYDGSQDYDLLLRLSERVRRFYHIDRILYHWRAHEQSTAGSSLSKDYAYEAGQRALDDYMKRRGIPAQVCAKKGRQSYTVHYLPGSCSFPVLNLRDKSQWETLTGNSAGGEYVLLYDGTLIKRPGDGLQQELFGYTLVGKVGMVGVRFSSHGKLLSSGYQLDSDGRLQPQFAGLPVKFHGPFDRAVIPQNVTALPLTCVLLNTRFLPMLVDLISAYYKTGVGHPQDASPWSDMDLALALADQIRQAGYTVVLDADQTLDCRVV